VKEVDKLETSKTIILQNIREGFATAYNHLVIDEALKGNGISIANSLWPDSLIE
jgi:hypothetical protein